MYSDALTQPGWDHGFKPMNMNITVCCAFPPPTKQELATTKGIPAPLTLRTLLMLLLLLLLLLLQPVEPS
jgi:hypothetical protein